MGFVEGKCRKCKGVLQLPEDRETIICMYCGEEIAVQDAVLLAGDAAKEQEALAEAVNKERCQEYIAQALAGFPTMLEELEEPIGQFNKKSYEDVFMQYKEKHHTTLDDIHHAYMLTDDPEDLLLALARALTAAGANQIRSEQKKRRQDEKLMELNIGMVTYVFPVILNFRAEFSERLADQIIECWKEEFPKTNLKKSTFEDINGGFRKKLCYITTMLCEGLGKPDNCYELNLFRSYRDTWLVNEPGGEELIMEYYDIAPTIVKHMKQHPDAVQLYQNVYDEYLKPCIHMIEENDMDACREKYMSMVQDLKEEFLLCCNRR